jgi:serine/threonine protein kinase
VNGDPVSRQLYAINQQSMRIRFNKLKYTFQYTDYAGTQEFKTERNTYLTGGLKAPRLVDSKMPTPLASIRTIGPWTLADPLGRGGVGRVFLTSNSKNEVVAVKIIERNSRNASAMDRELQAFQDITALAKKHDQKMRIIRVKEVIRHKSSESSSRMPFKEIAVVIDPLTPQTLSNLMENSTKGLDPPSNLLSLFSII